MFAYYTVVRPCCREAVQPEPSAPNVRQINVMQFNSGLAFYLKLKLNMFCRAARLLSTFHKPWGPQAKYITSSVSLSVCCRAARLLSTFPSDRLMFNNNAWGPPTPGNQSVIITSLDSFVRCARCYFATNACMRL